MASESEQCCPQFDPIPWDGKIHKWENKKFIQAKVFTFFYMPLNFGSVMTRLDKLVHQTKAEVPEYLCLSEHTSPWNMNLYLAVDKEIENAQNTHLSGKFITKVYEGDFKDTGKWIQDFQAYVTQKGLNSSKMYMWYTTCPKCAKKYGKNYTVIFGQIE
jgi:hypothetical protein